MQYQTEQIKNTKRNMKTKWRNGNEKLNLCVFRGKVFSAELQIRKFAKVDGKKDLCH